MALATDQSVEHIPTTVGATFSPDEEHGGVLHFGDGEQASVHMTVTSVEHGECGDDDRWAFMEEICNFLRRAWTGEPFQWRGRLIHVTPRPEPPPPILLGGSSAASARRAARIADGWFPPLEPRLWTPYREACLELGKPDPGPYPRHGPIFLWISRDPDRDWDRLMPHILHQLHSYAEWTVEAFGQAAGPYAKKMSADNVRESDAYQVLAPEEALELAHALGDHSVFYLNPLLAGIDPKRSWEMLRLFENEVRPHLPWPDVHPAT